MKMILGRFNMPYYFEEYPGGAYYSGALTETSVMWGGYIKRKSAEKQYKSLSRNGHKLGEIYWSRRS